MSSCSCSRIWSETPGPSTKTIPRSSWRRRSPSVSAALAEPFTLGGTHFYATASLGVSLYPDDAHDAHSLLRNADSAMYQSKKAGPGDWLLYSESGDDPAQTLSLTTRLRGAVEGQDWVLHYQPIVELTTGAVRAVGALIRWRDPGGGMVAPGEFIPLAEELGLIEAIGDWVLAMSDPDRTQAILAELHARGLRLAIDDFGTGCSSLSRLNHLPVDILKIDRTFVRRVDRDQDLGSMVQAHGAAREEPRHDPARRGHRDGRGTGVPHRTRMSAGLGVLPGTARARHGGHRDRPRFRNRALSLAARSVR
jgi:predicted signal transduction protein with EAL and GGDEF domain